MVAIPSVRGTSLWHQAATFGAWPIVMAASVASSYVEVKHGLPPVAAVAISGAGSFCAAKALEKAVPKNPNWANRPREDALDAYHLLLTEGGAQVAFRESIPD